VISVLAVVVVLLLGADWREAQRALEREAARVVEMTRRVREREEEVRRVLAQLAMLRDSAAALERSLLVERALASTSAMLCSAFVQVERERKRR
jgi:energy-converting hydrogenase Eha subunit H